VFLPHFIQVKVEVFSCHLQALTKGKTPRNWQLVVVPNMQRMTLLRQMGPVENGMLKSKLYEENKCGCSGIAVDTIDVFYVKSCLRQRLA
jgi:hypothetical protein